MNNLSFNFQNQTVIVTGGTRGIGAAITKAFLEAGAFVYAIYAGNDKAANEFKDQVKEKAEFLELIKCDVSNASEVNQFFEKLDEREVKIDVLINNSGIRRDGLTASMDISDFNKVMEVNLNGTLLMSQKAVLNMMKSRYGRIINISSVSGVLGLAGQANYSCSKAGQIALSKVMAKEVAKRGITINSILPGFIETDLISDLPEDQLKEYKKDVPLKRFGRPDEVASCVMFLASKEASYMTGAEINLSGGLL